MNKDDARELMNTAAVLERRRINLHVDATAPGSRSADDAGELHAIARRLHRYDERNCSEDLGCRKCNGNGIITETTNHGVTLPSPVPGGETCKACAGKGHTLGRREARAEERAREIAARYRMRAYFQGDCRGCPLYLIPEESIPKMPSPQVADLLPDSRLADVASVKRAQASWISSHYSSVGVAVCH